MPEPEAQAGLGSSTADDPAPGVPLPQRLSGTWSGDSAGRPVRFYLDFSADGSVRGSAEVRIGPRYVQKALVGRYRDDGGGRASLSLTETEGPKPTAWVGHFDGQTLGGEVQVAGHSSGSFSIAPAR